MIAMENLDRLRSLAEKLGAYLPDVQIVLDYLVRYGYLQINPLSFALDMESTLAKIREAIKTFRERAALGDGEIDPQLLGKMTEPRCGCSDFMRQVEFAKWPRKSLKYFVASYVSGLSRTDQDDLIRLAWNDWQAAADISLAQVTSQQGADIVISTGRGRNQGFDGGGGTLAWAYLPNGSGQQLLMRFDLDERWMKDSPQGGVLYRNVACHEFGHLLGLDHSRASGALMAPFYSPSIVTPQANDDIPRIQSLYGKPAAPVPPVEPPTVPTPSSKTIVTLEVEGKAARIVSVA